MAGPFTGKIITAVLDGGAVPVRLEHWTHSIGSQPSEVVVQLLNVDGRDYSPATYEGKTAVVTVDGSPIITGHVYESEVDQTNLAVLLTILDRRQLLQSDWVGRQHLDTLDANGDVTAYNGVRVLGADIEFNRDGLPNKDAATSGNTAEFIYEKGNVTDPEDCATIEADYWLASDALDWLWRNYVASIFTKPTIPAYGGLEKKIGPTMIFPMRLDAALDRIFENTTCNWSVDGAGLAYIFNEDNPHATASMKTMATTQEIGALEYEDAIPVRFRVIRSIRNVVTDLEIVGGKAQKEIMLTAADFLAAVEEKSIDPATRLIPDPVYGWGGTGNTYVRTWSNYGGQIKRWKHAFSHARYETQGAGQNTRQKELPKPIIATLLTARNKAGGYVNPESECARYSVSTDEMVRGEYLNARLDLDHAELIENALIATAAPSHWTQVIQTEGRKYVLAQAAQGTLPVRFHLPVLREDIVDKRRNSVKVMCPVDILWIITFGAPITYSWTATPAISLPTGAVLDFATSGSGTGLGAPPFDATMTLLAGKVVDGVAPLTELKDMVVSQLGRPAVNVTGSFPIYKTIAIGDLIAMTGPSWGLSGKEVIVALTFDGRTQRLDFAATNHLGGDATQLARRFIDVRRFRRNY